MNILASSAEPSFRLQQTVCRIDAPRREPLFIINTNLGEQRFYSVKHRGEFKANTPFTHGGLTLAVSAQTLEIRTPCCNRRMERNRTYSRRRRPYMGCGYCRSIFTPAPVLPNHGDWRQSESARRRQQSLAHRVLTQWGETLAPDPLSSVLIVHDLNTMVEQYRDKLRWESDARAAREKAERKRLAVLVQERKDFKRLTAFVDEIANLFPDDDAITGAEAKTLIQSVLQAQRQGERD